jgi:hypothetical protein
MAAIGPVILVLLGGLSALAKAGVAVRPARRSERDRRTKRPSSWPVRRPVVSFPCRGALGKGWTRRTHSVAFLRPGRGRNIGDEWLGLLSIDRLHGPVGGYVPGVPGGRDGPAVHEPNGRVAAGVTPEDVGVAVTVEVAGPMTDHVVERVVVEWVRCWGRTELPHHDREMTLMTLLRRSAIISLCCTPLHVSNVVTCGSDLLEDRRL